MVEIHVSRFGDGPVVIVAHGQLKPDAEKQLMFAAEGLAVMLKSGLRTRVFINPETGDMTFNASRPLERV